MTTMNNIDWCDNCGAYRVYRLEHRVEIIDSAAIPIELDVCCVCGDSMATLSQLHKIAVDIKSA